MKILLADKRREIRSALRLLIEQEPDFSVIGEVSEVESLITQVELLQPDLVLLDWHLRGVRKTTDESRRFLISALQAKCPHLKIIALSGTLEARREALSAGVDVFISKGDSPEHLLDILHTLGASDKGKGKNL